LIPSEKYYLITRPDNRKNLKTIENKGRKLCGQVFSGIEIF